LVLDLGNCGNARCSGTGYNYKLEVRTLVANLEVPDFNQGEACTEEAITAQEQGDLEPNSRLVTDSIAIAVGINNSAPQTYLGWDACTSTLEGIKQDNHHLRTYAGYKLVKLMEEAHTIEEVIP
jgi:hypothetical protein